MILDVSEPYKFPLIEGSNDMLTVLLPLRLINYSYLEHHQPELPHLTLHNHRKINKLTFECILIRHQVFTSLYTHGPVGHAKGEGSTEW